MPLTLSMEGSGFVARTLRSASALRFQLLLYETRLGALPLASETSLDMSVEAGDRVSAHAGHFQMRSNGHRNGILRADWQWAQKGGFQSASQASILMQPPKLLSTPSGAVCNVSPNQKAGTCPVAKAFSRMRSIRSSSRDSD